MVKVISAEPIENYKLRILLSNGRKGIFDVSPYLVLQRDIHLAAIMRKIWYNFAQT